MTDRIPAGIRKVRRPKMADRSGRTWDICDVILPSGQTVTGHLDTTWGTRFYFERDGAWWAGSIDRFDAAGPSYTADLRIGSDT